ncbi:hypothetical protein AAE478_000070 [Parahypoxylon ruwenzoriense]
MSLLDKFYYFNRLPVEIQDMVWDFYRRRQGLRHYLTAYGQKSSSKPKRLYAALDPGTNRFIRTYGSSQIRFSKWPVRHPAVGEEDSVIRLVGSYAAPDPGIYGRSIITAKGVEWWKTRQALQIRINFHKDLVVIDGKDSGRCLNPLWTTVLSSQRPLADDHWIYRVRYLALQLGPTSSLDLASEDVLSEMKELQTLYLVTYRSPDCVFGTSPRDWKGFDKNLMDEHNFFPFAEFKRIHLLHPKHRQCLCESNDNAAVDMMDDLSDVLDPRVNIKIMVDPY